MGGGVRWDMVVQTCTHMPRHPKAVRFQFPSPRPGEEKNHKTTQTRKRKGTEGKLRLAGDGTVVKVKSTYCYNRSPAGFPTPPNPSSSPTSAPWYLILLLVIHIHTCKQNHSEGRGRKVIAI